MTKQSGYLMRQRQQREEELRRHRYITTQWCEDAAILAANEVFQRRGDKLDEFRQAYRKWAMEIANTTLEDAANDQEIWFTKGRLDELLKDVLGEHFVPWDERYQ